MDAENDTDAQQVTGCPVTGKAGCQLDAVSLIDPERSAKSFLSSLPVPCLRVFAAMGLQYAGLPRAARRRRGVSAP